MDLLTLVTGTAIGSFKIIDIVGFRAPKPVRPRSCLRIHANAAHVCWHALQEQSKSQDDLLQADQPTGSRSYAHIFPGLGPGR